MNKKKAWMCCFKSWRRKERRSNSWMNQQVSKSYPAKRTSEMARSSTANVRRDKNKSSVMLMILIVTKTEMTLMKMIWDMASK